MSNDIWEIGGKQLTSRVMIGSARYVSMQNMLDAVQSSGSEVITVSLRREDPKARAGDKFWQQLKTLDNCHILPNTAGCRSVEEVIATAEMAREIFETDWLKLEVIGDSYTLQPDTTLLIEAAAALNKRGFTVFPYMTEDMVIATKLVDAGCEILMPWGSPIGSGQGLNNVYGLQVLRERFPDIQLIVDAGIGTPSDAVQAFELGYDGVLLNTAIAKAKDSVLMGEAFKYAALAGRQAYLAGRMPVRDLAEPSTPLVDVPFWQQMGND